LVSNWVTPDVRGNGEFTIVSGREGQRDLMSASAAAAARDAGRSGFARAGIFLGGSVLVVLGGAAWLLSALLTVPFMLAGLWVWSREFGWAHRLFHRCLDWARSLWGRTRRHPVRWGVATAASIGATALAYWQWLA